MRAPDRRSGDETVTRERPQIVTRSGLRLTALCIPLDAVCLSTLSFLVAAPLAPLAKKRGAIATHPKGKHAHRLETEGLSDEDCAR